MDWTRMRAYSHLHGTRKFAYVQLCPEEKEKRKSNESLTIFDSSYWVRSICSEEDLYMVVRAETLDNSRNKRDLRVQRMEHDSLVQQQEASHQLPSPCSRQSSHRLSSQQRYMWDQETLPPQQLFKHQSRFSRIQLVWNFTDWAVALDWGSFGGQFWLS